MRFLPSLLLLLGLAACPAQASVLRQSVTLGISPPGGRSYVHADPSTGEAVTIVSSAGGGPFHDVLDIASAHDPARDALNGLGVEVDFFLSTPADSASLSIDAALSYVGSGGEAVTLALFDRLVLTGSRGDVRARASFHLRAGVAAFFDGLGDGRLRLLTRQTGDAVYRGREGSAMLEGRADLTFAYYYGESPLPTRDVALAQTPLPAPLALLGLAVLGLAGVGRARGRGARASAARQPARNGPAIRETVRLRFG